MLSGPRVTLRALRRDDLPLLCAYNNDLRVELAGGGDPPMPQPLERLIAEFERAAAAGGRDDGRFAIEIDGRFAGGCGLFDFNWTNRTAQLGIGIGDPSRWGQGYGREAIGLLLDYAFRLRNLRRVWLRTHERNERAIRCYRACGFQEEGRLRQHVWTDGGYQDEVYMGILRPEWLAARADRRDAVAVEPGDQETDRRSSASGIKPAPDAE